MIKKILPTMVGAILAGGMTAAASADVTVFGHLDTSVVNWSDESHILVGEPGDVNDDDTNFVCTTCSIGFKGSEDLGNGLKAIFKVDFQFDMFERNSDGSITDRDQYLGLAGNFGQVVFGTMSTTYKSHGALLDPGYRTVAQMRDVGIQSRLHAGAGEEGQGRATHTMRYDSPDFSGFQVGATYTLDSGENDGEDDNPYSIGAQYSNGGILVFADYITDDNGGNDDAWKVGGKFAMDSFSVFGQYESDGGLISQNTQSWMNYPEAYQTGDINDPNTDGADMWMLGGSYTMGNNTVYAAYGHQDDAEKDFGDLNNEWDSWEIVGVHGLSARTLVYAGYVAANFDADYLDDIDLWTIGMKHKF